MAARSISITPIIITLVFFFLIDLYVFKGLKVLLSEMTNLSLRKGILIGHWVLTAGLMIWFFGVILNVSNGADARQYKNTYFLIGFIMLIYLPKIVFSVFIFSDDIILLFRNIIGFFVPKTAEGSGENISRLKFIYQIGAGVAAIPFVGAAYGMLKGRFDYGVKRVKVVLPNLPKSFEGMTMVQLSDLHLGSFFDDKASVAPGLKMVADINPDLLVVTGDWVNNYSSEAESWIEEFKALPAKIAKLAIVGNHDYGDYSKWDTQADKDNNFARLLEIHKEMGFKSLMNDNYIVENKGEKFAVIGVENWGVKPFPQHGDLDKAKVGTEDVPVKVLLSHDPSHFEEVVFKTRSFGYRFDTFRAYPWRSIWCGAWKY